MTAESLTQAEAIAVAIDAALESGTFPLTLREQVAVVPGKMRIATAWCGGQRFDAATGRELCRVGWSPVSATLTVWHGRIRIEDDWLASFDFVTEATANAWVDAHLRAVDYITPGSRAPRPGERTVLLYDDPGQLVRGTLRESFIDEVEEDGAGLLTYRIEGDDGQIWESPYACCEAEIGAAP